MMTGLGRCSRGAVAVVTAMVLTALVGISSLDVEVGHWYLGARVMQGAADAATISAAARYIQDQNAGNTSSMAYQTVGQNYASLNGFAIPSLPGSGIGDGTITGLINPYLAQRP